MINVDAVPWAQRRGDRAQYSYEIDSTVAEDAFDKRVCTRYAERGTSWKLVPHENISANDRIYKYEIMDIKEQR